MDDLEELGPLAPLVSTGSRVLCGLDDLMAARRGDEVDPFHTGRNTLRRVDDGA